MAKKKTEKEQPKIKQAANFENAGLVMEQHIVDVLEEKGYTGYLESYFDSLFNEITGEDINEYLCQGYTYRELAEMLEKGNLR